MKKFSGSSSAPFLACQDGEGSVRLLTAQETQYLGSAGTDRTASAMGLLGPLTTRIKDGNHRH
jgi:hypothetical protein